MRNLTLDEKISLKGLLARKGFRLAGLDMEIALFLYNRCYGDSILYWYKKTLNRKKRPLQSIADRLF